MENTFLILFIGSQVYGVIVRKTELLGAAAHFQASCECNPAERVERI